VILISEYIGRVAWRVKRSISMEKCTVTNPLTTRHVSSEKTETDETPETVGNTSRTSGN
jgi:hypothetical protein